ncbi:phage portal protein [Bradyrhizobium sp. SZCCHNR2012]|uniref:phage portal protein n=1 Tax=Bradyrhizobium sp. SZCCHNR2012 TaxID=3057377 RepID=UPI0028E5CF3E|nr:phage portal protein [Bradyrhizobium sp. SZCCHNR2012]
MQAQPKPRYRIGSDGSNARLVPGALPPAGVGKPGSFYMREQHSPFFHSWTPALRDQREDVRAGYWSAAARAIDTLHNSGWLAGGIEQACVNMIGDGLRLAAKPDADALGWTKDEADRWARDVERKFEAHANNPIEVDAAGKQTLGQMTRAGLNSFFSHGEVLALLPRPRNPFAKTRVKLKLLPAHKLRQDSNNIDTYQGVRMTAWGFPLSYKIMLRLHQWDTEFPEVIPARDGIGRKQVLHVFDGLAGQVRGITPLAPALKIVRQYDNLSDLTLQAALIQTIFAATLQSEAPTQDVLQALQDDEEQGVGGGSLEGLLSAKGDWYESTKIDLGRGGKIAHLFPGEELKFNASNSPNDNYEAFAKMLLREIARCVGTTYETLTGDYSGATYSSVRMATSETWPTTLYRRKHIAAPLCQAVYCAWLDEQIEAGEIPFPGGIEGFRAKADAATKSEWRGPPKPQADDLKTQKAHEGYRNMGVMTDEQICAELGQDWEDVYEQREREMKLRQKLGLPEGNVAQAAQDDRLADQLIRDDNQSAGGNE